MGFSVSKQEKKQQIKYPFLADQHRDIKSEYPNNQMPVHTSDPSAPPKSQHQTVNNKIDNEKCTGRNEKERAGQVEKQMDRSQNKESLKPDPKETVKIQAQGNVKPQPKESLRPQAQESVVESNINLKMQSKESIKLQSKTSKKQNVKFADSSPSATPPELARSQKQKKQPRILRQPPPVQVEGTQYQPYRQLFVPSIRGISKHALPDFQPANKNTSHQRIPIRRGEIPIAIVRSQSKLNASSVSLGVK